jgi:hypothetical protein
MSKNSFFVFQKTKSSTGLFAAFLCLSGLVGCGSMPAHEFEPFTPLPQNKRVMVQPKIKWEIRDDVAAFCAQAKGMGQEQAFMTPPLACAIWHTGKNECTVVTGRLVTHVALGHEIRHCFEGHFH